MTNKKFVKHSGLFPAVFTPFKEDYEVNYLKIPEYMEFLYKNGIRGIFLNGSTGESFSLTVEERKKIMKAWMDVKKEDFTVIAHISDLCFKNVEELGRYALDLDVDGISTMGSFYFRAGTVEDLVENTASIAAKFPDLPYYYYYIPSLNGINFEMRKFVKLALDKIPNFAGIKYTHMNLMDFSQVVQMTRDIEYFTAFSGYDQLMLQYMTFGSPAAVGSTYNFAAPLYNQIRKSFNKGGDNIGKAMELQEKAIRLIEVFEDTHNFLAAAKYAMGLIGMDLGPNRLPIRPLTDELKKKVEKAIYSDEFAEWLCKL